MHRFITALLCITIVMSCKKETNEPKVAPPLQLLTTGKWTLSAYGWDDDSSGNIEAHENLILDCQKDNTVQFFTNGNAQGLENQEACGNNTPESNFTWKFIDDEKAIEVEQVRYDIRTLNKTELYFVVHVQYLITPLHVKFVK